MMLVLPVTGSPVLSDIGTTEIFQDLTDRSEKFCEHWEVGEVGRWRSAMKLLHHPEKGWLRFESEMLHDPENDHRIMLYTPRGDG